MDTKFLYDLAYAARLNFKDPDPSDAVDVWVCGIIESPEWLVDLLPDMLEGLLVPGPQYSEFHKVLSIAFQRKRWMAETRDPESVAAFAGTYALNATYAAEEILKCLESALTKHVEKHADEWWTDVHGYVSDMEEGAREDYYDGLAADRRMERD